MTLLEKALEQRHVEMQAVIEEYEAKIQQTRDKLNSEHEQAVSSLFDY